VHRWVIKVVPLFAKTFRKHKRPVGKSWRVDEAYIKVKGSWKYLYRAVNKAGNTIDFLFRARMDPSVTPAVLSHLHYSLMRRFVGTVPER
jgi:transposase-like protein